MTKQITTRSKIRVAWTTCPADMGYGGNPTNWRENFEIMGMRQAAAFAWKLEQKIGNGCYRLISYRHGDMELSASAIAEIVAMADCGRL